MRNKPYWINSESVKALEQTPKIHKYYSISWDLQINIRHFSKRYTFARCESFIQYQLGRLIGPCKSKVLKIWVMDQSVSSYKIFQRQRLSSIQELSPYILGSCPLHRNPEPWVRSLSFLQSAEGGFIFLGWTEMAKAT